MIRNFPLLLLLLQSTFLYSQEIPALRKTGPSCDGAIMQWYCPGFVNCADSVFGYTTIYISGNDTVILRGMMDVIDCNPLPGHVFVFKDSILIDSANYELAVKETGSYYMLACESPFGSSQHCFFTTSLTIINTSITTGVQQYDTESEIKVSTLSGVLTLLHLDKTKDCALRLYDLNGRKVFEKDIHGKQQRVEISTGSSLHGLFILELQNPDFSIKRKINLL